MIFRQRKRSVREWVITYLALVIAMVFYVYLYTYALSLPDFEGFLATAATFFVLDFLLQKLLGRKTTVPPNR
jgi:hypothetical protein